MDIISIYYDSMNKEIKQRLKWIELYEETNNAGLVCRRCGLNKHRFGKTFTLTTKLKKNAFSYRIISVIFNSEK
ncbi:hypothetical protein ALTERO38_52097 [Alteromonas sp. 38]|nr:hypothetical protein ALTERO38_52097 [Alteromonas sp. 38]